MKVLLAHIEAFPDHGAWYRAIAQAAGPALEVRTFGVTLNPPGPRLSFSALDRLWRRRDRTLLEMYERLLRAADDCDVLLLYNGANLHPGLLPELPTFNVYCCFDDPESSAGLSRPLAPAFDAVLYGNIASRFQYEHWGCRKLAWIPNINPPADLPSREERARILEGPRDVDLVLCAERTSPWRRQRLDQLTAVFPQALCYGSGWPAGRVSDERLRDLYTRARIGWNLHNSTGPINRRLFALPAFGALQICDNKTGLGQIFQLGEEVVGFDTIPEAVELTRHYLAHEDEARQIARRGYERFWRDYHAGAIWERVHRQLEAWGAARKRSALVSAPRLVPDLPARIGATARDVLRPYARRARRLAGFLERRWRDRGAPRRPAFDDRFYRGEDVVPYRENPEMRGVNFAAERLKHGDPLDWPDVLALNWAVTALIGDARRIVEIGSGTGAFAEFAAVVPGRRIDCFEEDAFARSKATLLRSHERVRYFDRYEANLSGRYDLLVSVEVIEHVDDVRAHLDFCSQLAPRAIFTTPNRQRGANADSSGPPHYAPHVREYTAGELLWLLRLYYRAVRLFHLPDAHVPWLAPMTVASRGTPIVAECRDPYPARIEIGADEPETSALSGASARSPASGGRPDREAHGSR